MTHSSPSDSACVSPAARQPLVSVVMPTHHRPAMLRRALQSLLKQTYPHERIEIIVVASENDQAFDLVSESFDTTFAGMRCVRIPDDPDHGRNPSAKRNYGVSVSRGGWIAFIDDDCVADPRWIEAASQRFDDPRVGAIEGRKVIPPVDPPTVTYKGLLQFTRPGGYQTCNMFYRRDVFDQVGGFDLSFPFYLEDSDLAWAVLDAGYEIPFANDAIVEHPATDAAPWRLLADAKRAVLLPYLSKKHPDRYRQAKMRALRPAHWLYLMGYLAVLGFGLVGLWWGSLISLAAVLGLLILHNLKLFAGCRVRFHELVVTNLMLPIAPVVRLVQLFRGNLRYGVWLWS